MYELLLQDAPGEPWEVYASRSNHDAIEEILVAMYDAPGYLLVKFRITHNGNVIEYGQFGQ